MARQPLTHRQQYVLVRGAGIFPMDMLRYDSACPASEHDSYEIAKGVMAPERVVLLRRFIACGLKEDPRSGARWKSFSWELLAWGPPEEVMKRLRKLVEDERRGR